MAEVLESGWLGLGERTRAFEEALSERLAGRHVVAVDSGTSALVLALAEVGCGPGDEVVLPSFTYIACAQAVLAVGSAPVFCEIEAATLNVDPADLAARVGPRTRAVMPVHNRGLPCDLAAVREIAEAAGVRVVEDAAHALGSTIDGAPVGSTGDLACLSFDPIKNATCGDGGAVVTGDAEEAERLRRARSLGIDRDGWSRYRHARPWHYDVPAPGRRAHLSNINAAIGVCQLEGFDERVDRKRAVAAVYDEAFAPLGGVRPLPMDYATVAPLLYVLRAHRRDELMAHLAERGVESGIHFPPIHLFSGFAGGPGDLPVTEAVAGEVVSLPLFPDITDAEVDAVISAVEGFCR